MVGGGGGLFRGVCTRCVCTYVCMYVCMVSSIQ